MKWKINFKLLFMLCILEQLNIWLIIKKSVSKLNKNLESLNNIIANGVNLITKRTRNDRIKTKISNSLNFNVTLQNIYYLQEQENSLISVKKITDKACSVIFEEKKLTKIYLEKATRDNNL